MDAIPPEYDKETKERIYRQEWLEYFHYIGLDAAMREHPAQYRAIYASLTNALPHASKSSVNGATDSVMPPYMQNALSAGPAAIHGGQQQHNSYHRTAASGVYSGPVHTAPPAQTKAAHLFIDDSSSGSDSSSSSDGSSSLSSVSSSLTRSSRQSLASARQQLKHRRGTEDGGEGGRKRALSRHRHRSQSASNGNRHRTHRRRDGSRHRSTRRSEKSRRKRETDDGGRRKRERGESRGGDGEKDSRRHRRRSRGSHHTVEEEERRHRRHHDEERRHHRPGKEGKGEREHGRERTGTSAGGVQRGRYALKDDRDRRRGKGGAGSSSGAVDVDRYEDRKEDARQRRQRDAEGRRR